MTVSNVDPATFACKASVQTPEEFKYDVRLEVTVQTGSETVAILSIFRDLVKKMKETVDAGKPLAVLTATDEMFFEHKAMSSDEFKRAFMVDQIEGRITKVMLGFKLRTMTTLYDIKQRLMKTYLIPHNLFMREHVGGFTNGLKQSAYGFLKMDHPDHPDISSLNNRFAKLLSEAWKKLAKEERTKWKDELPQAFYGDTGVTVPIIFSKERLSAAKANDEKTKITTSALVISTPTKYGKLLRSLLDIAVIGKKINNLIPFALNREDSNGYFHLVAQQERFMDLHRNIPILQVPYDAATRPGTQGQTLSQILNGNKDIQRVAYDPKHGRYHVSTHAPKYREVHTWINKVLADNQFPYNPTLRPLKYTGSGSATKYSAVFADAMSVATASYDGSTIKMPRSAAWKQRPPLNISYDPTAEAFPPLPIKNNPAPATQSTTSETILDEETIQSAISSALKKLEDQHRTELEALKKDMQNKMTAMENQMLELGKQIATQTYQALVTEDSPLVTKQDHAHLQTEMASITTQLTTLIELLKKGHIVTPMSLDETQAMSRDDPKATSTPPRHKRSKPNLTPQKPSRFEALLTQDDHLTSAASDLDEGSEGCED